MHLLRFTQSQTAFYVNDQVRSYNVDTYECLGIENAHITIVVNKATRMLNFIKRNLCICSDDYAQNSLHFLFRISL